MWRTASSVKMQCSQGLTPALWVFELAYPVKGAGLEEAGFCWGLAALHVC